MMEHIEGLEPRLDSYAAAYVKFLEKQAKTLLDEAYFAQKIVTSHLNGYSNLEDATSPQFAELANAMNKYNEVVVRLMLAMGRIAHLRESGHDDRELQSQYYSMSCDETRNENRWSVYPNTYHKPTNFAERFSCRELALERFWELVRSEAYE
jgi:hypothetical protein